MTLQWNFKEHGVRFFSISIFTLEAKIEKKIVHAILLFVLLHFGSVDSFHNME